MAATKTEFKRGTRIVLTDDIPGVPEGTGGKVGRAVGFTLTRYRVRFDNAVEATSVAADKLVLAADWETFRAEREAAREAAEAAAAKKGASDERERQEQQQPARDSGHREQQLE